MDPRKEYLLVPTCCRFEPAVITRLPGPAFEPESGMLTQLS